MADNDAPKLSSDRLEYTIGNMINYGLCSATDSKTIYDDIVLSSNEYGEEELSFESFDLAERFAILSLECSKVYVSPEDRYSMQILSEILASALGKNVILYSDLYGRESDVIRKMEEDSEIGEMWNRYRSLSHMVKSEGHADISRVVFAKKRKIDPMVAGAGRVSSLSEKYRRMLQKYAEEDFSVPLAAE